MATPKESELDVHDPALYAELSAGFADQATASAALDAFFADVRAARIKHRIPEAAVVAIAYAGADREPFISMHHNGDAAKQPKMLAWALGMAERAEREHLDAVRRKAAAGTSARKSKEERDA